MSALFAALLAASSHAQGPKPNPKPVWTVDGFEQPESAQQDPQTGFIYVSNVAGEPQAKDGRGWISKLDAKGKVLKRQWVSGLNAPKGLRVCGGRLFVADIDQLVEISLSTGGVVSRLPVRDAKMLNGLAVDAACAVYVSDTFASRVYKAVKKDVTIVAEGPALQSPNGLALDPSGKALIIAAWGLTTDWTTKTPGRLLKLDLASRKASAMPGPVGNLDGLVRHKGAWHVSDWASGTVLRVAPNGQSSVLLHGLQGPADLGTAGSLLLVPRMRDNRVDAYSL